MCFMVYGECGGLGYSKNGTISACVSPLFRLLIGGFDLAVLGVSYRMWLVGSVVSLPPWGGSW